MTEPSINFHAKYAAGHVPYMMYVSAPNILASILHYATSKTEHCCPCLLYVFLLHRQRALLLHQAYHFLVVEEEFRIRRRNQHRSMLMFFSQMNQQNTQRRQRRAWLRARPQNWFRSFLANPALNFLWEEHFHVLESQASSKQVVRK